MERGASPPCDFSEYAAVPSCGHQRATARGARYCGQCVSPATRGWKGLRIAYLSAPCGRYQARHGVERRVSVSESARSSGARECVTVHGARPQAHIAVGTASTGERADESAYACIGARQRAARRGGAYRDVSDRLREVAAGHGKHSPDRQLRRADEEERLSAVLPMPRGPGRALRGPMCEHRSIFGPRIIL